MLNTNNSYINTNNYYKRNTPDSKLETTQSYSKRRRKEPEEEEEQGAGTSITKLHTEMILNILSFLPPKDIMSFQASQ